MKNILVLAVALILSACGPNYSNGSRVGVVTKLSYKGLVWKSWEGELNMGGVRQQSDGNGGTQTVPNVFTFNADPDAVAKLQDAMKTGARVELIYRQWFISPASIDNDHVIIDVKPAE